ncbi:hypothetical protein [Segeticoccus rhizosphaerae]|uniref:hypothetical protein n=1 Tax=Segeticoccus rhizosphaerae TaxID=1104777 RepID=UPI00126493A6|nr:hypothetical protein [Segeticoccus rhizosphaerae]
MGSRLDPRSPDTANSTPAGTPPADSERLLRVLIRALRGLGEAGDPDQASRLAARAWSEVRHSNPAAAERLNGTMHYLARLPDPTNTPHLGHSAPDRTPQGD